jgi:dTDP-4-amino-4,6-dideoxygalactose transaminase
MSRYKIPLSYTPIDSQGLQEVIERFAGRHHNDIIVEFEGNIQTVTGAPHVVALNSGTSAIHLALKLAGVGPGDFVIVPTFTYVATVNPILYENAIPVFIDSEPKTWNMDPNLLETAIQELTVKNKTPKAIVVVHVYGIPAAINDILKIAAQYNIAVIEDAAEAIGSKVNNQQVGTLASLGILSFNTNKIATTYGGGALLTRDKEFMQKARYWSTQSRDDLPYYNHREVGYNYKLSPLNAAQGILQMGKLGSLVEARRLAFQRYKEVLSDTCSFQHEHHGDFANRWLTCVLLKDQRTRLSVEKRLISEGIESRPLWNPMHHQPIFEKYPCFTNTVSEDLYSRGICLPSNLDKSTQDLVLKSLSGALKVSV